MAEQNDERSAQADVKVSFDVAAERLGISQGMRKLS
jgi:hypothetical protein